MGVDIGTYRSRIGTFRHGCGVDVLTLQLTINYYGALRCIGAVAFIGLLLLMAGVESNPGPNTPRTSDLDTNNSGTTLPEPSETESNASGTSVPQQLDMEPSTPDTSIQKQTDILPNALDIPVPESLDKEPNISDTLASEQSGTEQKVPDISVPEQSDTLPTTLDTPVPEPSDIEPHTPDTVLPEHLNIRPKTADTQAQEQSDTEPNTPDKSVSEQSDSEPKSSDTVVPEEPDTEPKAANIPIPEQIVSEPKSPDTLVPQESDTKPNATNTTIQEQSVSEPKSPDTLVPEESNTELKAVNTTIPEQSVSEPKAQDTPVLEQSDPEPKASNPPVPEQSHIEPKAQDTPIPEESDMEPNAPDAPVSEELDEEQTATCTSIPEQSEPKAQDTSVLEQSDTEPNSPDTQVPEQADKEPTDPDTPLLEQSDMEPKAPSTPVLEQLDTEPKTPGTPVLEQLDTEPKTPGTPVLEQSDTDPSASDTSVVEQMDTESRVPNTLVLEQSDSEPNSPDTQVPEQADKEPNAPDTPLLEQSDTETNAPDTSVVEQLDTEPKVPDTSVLEQSETELKVPDTPVLEQSDTEPSAPYAPVPEQSDTEPNAPGVPALEQRSTEPKALDAQPPDHSVSKPKVPSTLVQEPPFSEPNVAGISIPEEKSPNTAAKPSKAEQTISEPLDMKSDTQTTQVLEPNSPSTSVPEPNSPASDEPTRQLPSVADVVERLGLTNWFPGKITTQDVLAVETKHEKKAGDIKDIPWLMLKRFMLVNSEARDQTVAECFKCVPTNEGENFDDIFDEPEDEALDNSICPLDVFVAVFHCCDPMLKQVLYKKLYACRIALPLAYIDPMSNNLVLSIWPLRSLLMERKNKSDDEKSKGTEISVLKESTKITVFCRFGRPVYSKSKLENDLLSEQSHHTFYDKDCVFGMGPGRNCSGYMECAWYLPTGNDNDFSKDPLMFVNQRGDVSRCNDIQIKCAQNLADVLVIVLDINTIRQKQQNLANLIKHIRNVIFVIPNPGRNDLKNAKEILKPVFDTKSKPIKVVTTHKNGIEKNTLEIKKTMKDYISSCVETMPAQKLSHRFKSVLKVGAKSDEDIEDCIQGKQLATAVVQNLLLSGTQSEWKSKVTAAHYHYSGPIRELDKKLKRARNTIDEPEKIKENIRELQLLQIQNISETEKGFIHTFISEVNNKSRVLFFISWLRCKLDDKTRQVLPALMQTYFELCDKMQASISSNASKEEISQQEKTVQQAENKANDAQFGANHFFKELGQIYSAMNTLRKAPEDYGLPAYETVCEAVAKLISFGVPFELLDGESFSIPVVWVQDVLRHLSDTLGNTKILTLSVLGLQSSGKSTLLNTMFGLQLDVSSGRCTKGIHVHLLPVKQPAQTQYKHVLVIDSEGLRAPELGNNKPEHDNEMATFVIGLSDITILNVMGENTSEMREILQVTVYALLRFRLANKSVEMRQKACLVHQNVTAVNAAENMNFGIQKLIEGLNQITTEAATAQGISDVNQFSQIIEFNPKEQVWYLPNFVQGNPPMTVVNIGYSNIVGELRASIMHMMGETTDVRSISDFKVNVGDLWKGVTAEDFVFSFKNSIEIKAYIDLEQFCQELTWKFESTMQKKKQSEFSNTFPKCKTISDLEETSKKVLESLTIQLDECKSETKRNLTKYFDDADHKELINSWRTVKSTSIDLISVTLEQAWKIEIDKTMQKRKIEIMTFSSRQKHEEILYKKSIELAQQLRGKEISDSEIQHKFELIWHEFAKNVMHTTQIESGNEPLATTISTILFEDFFQFDRALLNDSMKEYGAFTTCPACDKLCGTFDKMVVTEEDINLTNQTKNKSSAIQLVKEETGGLFQELDDQIQNLTQMDEEIATSSVKEILHSIGKWFTKLCNKQHDIGYTCTVAFKAKLFVHISCHMHRVFEKHNEEFKKLHDLKNQLKKYKETVKGRFYGYLNDRKSEATAAKLFSAGIKTFISKLVSERLSLKMEETIWTLLPANLKYYLMIKIIEHLAEMNDFEMYMKYIKTPKVFATDFVREFSEKILFDGRNGKYYSVAKEETAKCFQCIKHSIEKCAKNVHKDGNGKISGWAQSFHQNLVDFAIPAECLREAEREQIENFENFRENLIAHLEIIEVDIVNEFAKKNKHNVTWVGQNPYTRIIDKIWGCTKVCQFCSEPCRHASTDEHKHDCIQHRPSGCNGLRNVCTNEVSLSSCNFNVQSDLRYHCGVLAYVCNPSGSSCSIKWHPYKEYRKYLPNWDIEPSTDMESTSKFWLWFIANFKDRLAKHYQYDVSNVPPAWSSITKEEALESFRLVYSV